MGESIVQGSTWALPFENQLILWLQSLGGEGSLIYYLMRFFTLFGEELILIAVVGIVYWGIDKRRGERIGVGIMTANLIFPLIKNIVKRTRPFHSRPDILNLKDVGGYSFPSGHSSGSASTFVGTAWAFRDAKQKWLKTTLLVCAIALPLLVALSRMYLGAHYFTDVVCGLAIGTGVVFLLDWLLKIIPNKFYLYGGILLVGVAGFFYCTTSDFYTNYGILFGLVAGLLFEQNVTKFQNTKVWWRIVLRVAVGGGLYLGLNALLKGVVGAIYPDYKLDFNFERFFRTFRYATIIFVLIGIYPMLFKVCDKLWKKLGWIKDEQPTAEVIAE